MKTANALPPDDPQRTELHDEVHARPPARIRLPALVLYIAVLASAKNHLLSLLGLETL